MHVTYDTLNEYVIVPLKNMKDAVNNVSDDAINNQYALCVPFYGSLSFLNEELKPFESWYIDNQGLAFLVKDIEKYTFNIPCNDWNSYVLHGVDHFKDYVDISTNGISVYSRGANYKFRYVPITIDNIKNNDILMNTTNISIYDLMYGINKFALEKAGISAKEASRAIQEKVKDTKGKAKLHLVPQQILYDIAEVREYGNKKYPTGGEDNWKLGDPKDYLDAAYRHLTKMVRDGIDSKDEESGIEHYKHLATNAAFICGFMGGEHEDI